MTVGTYEIRRALLKPVVAVRRRRAGDQPDSARFLLELHGYSRAAHDLMAVKAIDPHHLHRADLDGDSVVVDVGAFAGAGAAQIHELYGCRVYAFEPNPTAFEHLAARFAEVPSVTPLMYGLGPSDTTLPLELDGPGSSLHGTVESSGRTVDVEIRDVVATFAELGLDRVDLIKINIEGAEYDLLDRMIDAGLVPKVRYLLIQFHEWHPSAHRRRRAIRRELAKTHDVVWDFPWLFELWCDRSQPHPPPPEIDDAARDAIRAALIEAARARRSEAPTA
jgi:FkbM family methyltransferase